MVDIEMQPSQKTQIHLGSGDLDGQLLDFFFYLPSKKVHYRAHHGISPCDKQQICHGNGRELFVTKPIAFDVPPNKKLSMISQ